jgi:hypothetical protein
MKNDRCEVIVYIIHYTEKSEKFRSVSVFRYFRDDTEKNDFFR